MLLVYLSLGSFLQPTKSINAISIATNKTENFFILFPPQFCINAFIEGICEARRRNTWITDEGDKPMIIPPSTPA